MEHGPFYFHAQICICMGKVKVSNKLYIFISCHINFIPILSYGPYNNTKAGIPSCVRIHTHTYTQVCVKESRSVCMCIYKNKN
ncbi:hypothetical protein EON63_13625 [archaeon]|nr:MAG: hypothetical protein EON63_13625 [archaeon]